ncbi:MAG TPA: hypothetical protein VL966_12955 [Alphaproteobacteria bacterium]|jgi:hypothetical protein|nr:hypothetical protein [Alphaproteobacteria bacterium]
MSEDKIYCDGISNITLIGGMVRIDLFTLSPTGKDKNGRPSMQFLTQLIMPPDAFLQGLGAMQNLVQQLKEKGVVRPMPGEPVAADQKN